MNMFLLTTMQVVVYLEKGMQKDHQVVACLGWHLLNDLLPRHYSDSSSNGASSSDAIATSGSPVPLVSSTYPSTDKTYPRLEMSSSKPRIPMFSGTGFSAVGNGSSLTSLQAIDQTHSLIQKTYKKGTHISSS